MAQKLDFNLINGIILPFPMFKTLIKENKVQNDKSMPRPW